MKYVPPYGRENEGDEAHYINGNPAEGLQGSIPPANAFEHPMREVVDVIDKSKFTPSSNDLQQLTKAVRSQRLNFSDDTGSVNALAVAYDPPIATYTIGLMLRVRVRVSNTSTVTLDAGAGPVSVRHMDGAVCAPGDLPAGGVAEVVYDGTVWQLVNFLGQPGVGGGGDINSYYIKIPYCVDTSSTANTITAPFSPAITEIAAGDCILVKVMNTTTGPTQINVNALTAKAVKARGTGGTQEVTQGDMMINDVVFFVYDGTVWQMMPNTVITVDTILHVPSQFPTVAAAQLAIARKTISLDATVTIKLGIGNFPPFQIYHPCADRLVFDGTMKIPGVIPPGAFALTGNTPGLRGNDNAANLAMMRARFGTEINPGGPGVNCIQQLGPGRPTVSNMLIVGDGGGYYPGYDQNGIMVWVERQIYCYNVGACYLRTGFGQPGTFDCVSCYSIGCWSYGFLMSGPGSLQMQGCVANGNATGGVHSGQNGLFSVGSSYVCGNGYIGLEVNYNSYGSCQNCTVIANGQFDMYANMMSGLIAFSTAAYTSSPTSDVQGNNASLFLMR